MYLNLASPANHHDTQGKEHFVICWEKLIESLGNTAYPATIRIVIVTFLSYLRPLV